MSVAIRLLGKPRIERDGQPVGVARGRKTWALLAYLLLCEGQTSRSRVASLLFSEADDPLGALRWTLADLRRLVGGADVVGGDPLRLSLPEGVSVDVALEGGAARGVPFVLPDGELLERMSFPSSPVFDSWLGVMRRYLDGALRALKHDEALARLAGGDLDRATALASDLVSGDPLDQAGQELLIRCLARSGRTAEAEAQLAECKVLFRSELGIVPGPGLARAAGESDVRRGGAVGDSEAAFAQLQAGEAALEAGAVEPGVDILRHACAEAAGAGEVSLEARALAALGSALVHAVRGRDEEGALRLHEALRLAEACGDRATAAVACRELGYVDIQAGRNASAGRWLAQATELAEGSDELCAVLAVRGMALSDRGHYAGALELLHKSVARAERCGRARQVAFSLSLIGRVHLLRGDLALASPVIEESLALVTAERWSAFRPWPEALRGEVALLAGDPKRAEQDLDHAFRLACKLGDPCWEAMAVRLAGLLAAERSDLTAAREHFADALTRATRVSDPYTWVHAHILDSSATLAVQSEDHEARATVDRLAELAERCGLRELMVRAHLHRARLGDPTSAGTARVLAAEIDNPALAALLDAPIPA